MRVALAFACAIGLSCAADSARAEQLNQPVGRWWVGVASTQDLDIAIGIARLYGSDQSRVVTAQNGWYAVVLGPVTSNSLDDYKANYKGWPQLPSDVLFSRGNGYVATVWQPPVSPLLTEGELRVGKPVSLSAQGLSVIVSAAPVTDGKAAISFDATTPDEGSFHVTAPPAISSDFGSDAFLVRLDKTTRYPQAVGTLFTGGAHCCTDTFVATEVTAGRWTAVELGQLDGDGFSFEDIDGDGAAELINVDNSFLYAFESYAGSFAPLEIHRFVGGRLVDATHEPIFAHRLRQDLAGKEYLARHDPTLWHSNGFLAGWVAVKAQVGEVAEAWNKMIPLYDHHSDFGEMICLEPETIAQCPQAELSTLPFPDGLAKHLLENGYGPLPDGLAEVDPKIYSAYGGGAERTEPSATPTPVAAQPTTAAPTAPDSQQAVSQGTGFYVASDRLLTNAHVVDGCSDVVVRTGDTTLKGTIVAKDSTNDLAIIRTDKPSSAVAKLRTGVRLGEEVSTYGFPLNGLLASGGNFTRGNITAMAGVGDDTRYVQISDPVQPGNSGGPLLDESGNVVGVVSAKLNAIKVAALTQDVEQNVNFAIKAGTIEAFLDSNGVQYQTAQLGTGLSPTDIAQTAQSFTGLVNCH
jgi:S1-C subfamily serine protease